jgi:hypothetical protein
MTAAAILSGRDSILRYMQGGHAVLTMVSKKSGMRFTYRIRAPKTGNPGTAPSALFVDVLTGPTNTEDYTFIGTLFAAGEHGPFVRFRHSKKSPISDQAPSVSAFTWLTAALGRDSEVLRQAEIWTSGKCSRCSRRLTDPESIAVGMGPECREKALGGM